MFNCLMDADVFDTLNSSMVRHRDQCVLDFLTCDASFGPAHSARPEKQCLELETKKSGDFKIPNSRHQNSFTKQLHKFPKIKNPKEEKPVIWCWKGNLYMTHDYESYKSYMFNLCTKTLWAKWVVGWDQPEIRSSWGQSLGFESTACSGRQNRSSSGVLEVIWRSCAPMGPLLSHVVSTCLIKLLGTFGARGFFLWTIWSAQRCVRNMLFEVCRVLFLACQSINSNHSREMYKLKSIVTFKECRTGSLPGMLF